MSIRTLLAAALVAAGSSGAGAMTFDEWRSNSFGNRAMYVTGLVEGLFTATNAYGDEAEQRVIAHYDECLRRTAATMGALAEGIRIFGIQHRELQDLAMPSLLVEYLHEACGPLPGPP